MTFYNRICLLLFVFSFQSSLVSLWYALYQPVTILLDIISRVISDSLNTQKCEYVMITTRPVGRPLGHNKNRNVRLSMNTINMITGKLHDGFTQRALPVHTALVLVTNFKVTALSNGWNWKLYFVVSSYPVKFSTKTLTLALSRTLLK